MQYRSRYVFNTDRPFYVIERFRKNKWEFCFAEFDRKTANMLVNNPVLIEAERKKYKITGICVMAYVIIFTIYLIIK